MSTFGDLRVNRSDKARLLMLWESTSQGLRCSWRDHQSKAHLSFGRARVDAHERNNRWRLALSGGAT